MSGKPAWRQHIIPRYFICKLNNFGCRYEICPNYNNRYKEYLDNFDKCPERKMVR